VTSLDDLLDLLPDNQEGGITAADLRTVVTALWNHAWVVTDYPFAYGWEEATVSWGQIFVPDWSEAGTTVVLSNTTRTGVATPYGLLGKPGTLLRVRDQGTDAAFVFKVTDPWTAGSERYTLHGVAQEVDGAAPQPGASMTVVIVGEWEA